MLSGSAIHFLNHHKTVKSLGFSMVAIGRVCILMFSLVWGGAVYAEILLKTTSTWAGGEIIYPSGEAEITSIKLNIEEGKVTPFHCHPVPTLGYILSGKVEVELKTGKTMTFHEGDSVVEGFKTVHRGRAVGGPVEILVFYAGSTTVPNTVLSEDDLTHKFCHQ